MNTLNTIVHWFALNPFSGASVLFGLAILLAIGTTVAPAAA